MSKMIRVMRLLNRCRFRILVAWFTKGSYMIPIYWATGTLRHSLAVGSIDGDVKFRQKKDDLMLYKE